VAAALSPGVHMITAESTTGDGRTETASSTVVVDAPTADSTPPIITPTVVGTLGSDGWYTSDVSVS
jgi:hypothetical protein